MLWLSLICAALVIIIIALIIKIALLHSAADEICAQFRDRLEHDTNTLITVSGGDRHMRKIAAEINTQLRQLRRERHRFQQGDLELREAVTSISHDLRTPLTAICGYLDLMEREEKTENVTRYIDMIENRVEALKHLTEELFRYSVISATAGDVVSEDISLASALEESLAEHYAALTQRGIAPELSTPEEPVIRRLDSVALSRVFDNIISNAVKYSDGDLSVSLNRNGEIIFSNSAGDLTPVAVGKMFDRFFTVESGRSSTGLGLSIAKLLTEQMGGSISAQHESGKLSVILKF